MAPVYTSDFSKARKCEGDLGARLAAIPGVAAVEPFRVRRIQFNGQPAYLHRLDVGSRLAHGGLPMLAGNLADAAAALAAGTGVLVSDNLAFRYDIESGGSLLLDTPVGRRRFRVEGIYTDYLASRDIGSIALDHRQFENLYRDRSVNFFRLWLAAGTDASAARSAILQRLGSGYVVISAGEFRKNALHAFNRFFVAMWALQLVAALVAVVGIVTTQVATVLDRAREITTLRTIGVLRRDITRSTVIECGLLGMLGSLAGVALGTMLGALIVTVALRLITGLPLPFATATGPLATGVAVAVLVSAAAGWVPARAAAHVDAQHAPFD